MNLLKAGAQHYKEPQRWLGKIIFISILIEKRNRKLILKSNIQGRKSEAEN